MEKPRTILVNLVSEQPLPSLIPAFDKRFGIGEVILLVTEQMRPQARRLKRVYRRHELACRIWEKTIPPFAPGALEEIFFDLLAETPEDCPLILNATGGTKVMALTLANLFTQLDRGTVIYIDTARQQILYLHPDRRRRLAMEPVLTIADYLTAYGMEPKRPQARWQRGEELPPVSPAARYLARHAPGLDLFFGVLNDAGHQVLDPARARETWPRAAMMRKRPFPTDSQARGALEVLTREKLLTADGNLVTFTSEAAARFLSGGWLEEYAFACACRAGADEVALSQTVEWDAPGEREVRNEFDCLALKDNRLYLLECKTLRLDDEKGSDIIYKLDSLTDSTTGIYGRGALVSARRPTDYMLSRAQARRHRIFTPQELADLNKRLAKWFT